MKTTFPLPPRGIKAIPWRLPIWIYRLGLGGLLGKRFLLLTHQGRKSGKPRQNVLEIIRSDPDSRQYYVVSGFGERSDWYQNITKDPRVEIQVGWKKFSAAAERLGPDQASQVILAYTKEFPGNLKALASILGYEIEHTEAGYLAFGRQIPVIRISIINHPENLG